MSGVPSSGPMDSPPAPRDNLPDAFDRTVEVLESARAPYALIGGFAVAFHGIPRPTRDIDLLLGLPRISIPPLLERFLDRGFTFRMDDVIRRLGEDHLATLHFGEVPIDILDAILPVFRRTVEAAEVEEVRGRRVRIARAEDLIILKMIALREDDRRDVLGILAAKRTGLDLEAVRRGLRECCGEDRIEAFESMVREAAG
jgi:predicted nucleotidyltransferase